MIRINMIDDRSEKFLVLYEPHRDSLWRFTRSLVRTHHDAEDIVSETVLQALEGFHRLRDEQAFVSFLFTIASRIVKRQRWRRKLFGDFNSEEVESRHHSDPLPDVQADVDILRQAMRRLPTKTHEAILLFEINGFSLEEIRKIQGGSLSGVKSRLARGRQTLTRLLDDENVPQHSSPAILHQQTVL